MLTDGGFERMLTDAPSPPSTLTSAARTTPPSAYSAKVQAMARFTILASIERDIGCFLGEDVDWMDRARVRDSFYGFYFVVVSLCKNVRARRGPCYHRRR